MPDVLKILLKIWQQYKIPVCVGSVSIFSIAVSVILLVKSVQTQTPIQFSSNQELLGASREASLSARSGKMITVDVEGGVRAPGLYILPYSSRIGDAIDKAGGLSEEADGEAMAKQVNRASVLVDGAKVYVLKRTQSSQNVDTLLQHTSESQNVSVNINTASEAELDTLPGVGPVTAKKIIDNRPYQALEELVSKKALGQALFEKIKGNLSL